MAECLPRKESQQEFRCIAAVISVCRAIGPAAARTERNAMKTTKRVEGSGGYGEMLLQEPVGFRFGSDVAIYTERLLDGILVCADYRDNGIPVLRADEAKSGASFDLVIDGDSLYYGWEFAGFQGETLENGSVRSVVTLKNSRKDITLDVITLAGGFGFFTRSLEITNHSEKPVSITSVTPLQGTLFQMNKNLSDSLLNVSKAPYSVGYFRSAEYATEGDFTFSDIPYSAAVEFGSQKGRSGFGHPAFIAKNNIMGGYFLCQMGWSANWQARVACDAGKKESCSELSRLQFSMAPVSPSPARVLMPGERVSSPAVHFGLCHGNLDSLVQNLHRYQRQNLLMAPPGGKQPVILNHWGYIEHELSEEALKREIDLGASIGAEMFVVDAGWFGKKGEYWYESTGDWTAGERLPNDLFPVFDYARSKGLQVGLWVEIESAGRLSAVYQQHPDWFLHRYGKPVERMLDLTNPEAKAFVRSELFRLIERYSLDLLRLDYNTNVFEGGFHHAGDREENTLWRHVEALYEIFEEIKGRFPELHLETCSSGGGRTDVGIVSRFTTTWISDWFVMPRTVRILNGMSLVLPPEYLNRTFGVTMNGCYIGNLDTQLHAAILAHPAISGVAPAADDWNPAAMAAIKKYIGIYKEWIRPMHGRMRVFHHSPVLPGGDGDGWCALEYASEDGSTAVAGVFRQALADDDCYTFTFRGLDLGKTYSVTIEPAGQRFTRSGFDLCTTGLPFRLDTAVTSQLVMARAIE